MELGGAFKRLRSVTHRQPAAASERGDPADAYTALAGLFVGEGVIDDDLIGVLLDPSTDRDDALLELAAGRRCEAAGRVDEAVEHFGAAIEAGRLASATEVIAHAAHDCARALYTRNHPGDADRCWAMLEEARECAGARGMTRLRARIEELERGIREGAA